jgi:Lrp/AsnC family leucine-responsive transcriptional regulator
MPKTVRPKSASFEQPPIDRLDMHILRVLLDDSRKTLQEIGAVVGLSPTTCWTGSRSLKAPASSAATRWKSTTRCSDTATR